MPRWILAACASLGLSLSLGSLAPVGSTATATELQAVAKPSGGVGRDRFVGAWKLVGIERRDLNGGIVPPASPVVERDGYLIYDPAGYMAVSIVPRGRPRYAGRTPTDEEALATITGYAAYFGTFTIDEDESVVTHHLEGSLNPGMAAEQRRGFEFSGTRLTLAPPPGADGTRSRLTWERLPNATNLTAEEQRFLGFWKLVSYRRHTADGDPRFEPTYSGYIIYTPARFMMVHMLQPGRRPYAGSQPTPEEARNAARTYINYFGPFYVHEADGYVVHDQVGTLGLGRNGPSPQQRFYEFSGARLTLHPPRAALANGREVQDAVEWDRAGPATAAR